MLLSKNETAAIDPSIETKKYYMLFTVFLGIFQFSTQEAASQTPGEKSIFSLPKEYKVGFQQKTESQQVIEFVPKAETVEQWSKMITVQTFYKSAKMHPTEFEQRMVQNLKKGCPTAESGHVTDGFENGYPFSLWIEKFCADPTTGNSETTYFKAVQGKDALYVFQKAFKTPLTKEKALEATRFLRSAGVCDPRSTEHPCSHSRPTAQ